MSDTPPEASQAITGEQPIVATDTPEHTPDDTPAGGIVIRTRRWPRRLAWTALGFVVVLIVYYGITLWQVHATGRSDQARPVDAIVVLGAAQYDGRPSPQLAARLDHAAALWSQGLAGVMVVTGGKQPGDRFTEAEASANYLEARGVPSAAILEETAGHSTYESLDGAAALLRDRGLFRVLLVTDPFHSLRARLIAQELGLVAYVSPTRTSPVRGGTAFRHELEEAAGIAVGRLIGFRRLLRITG